MKKMKSVLLIFVLITVQTVFSQNKSDSLNKKLPDSLKMNQKNDSLVKKLPDSLKMNQKIDSLMNMFKKQNDAYKKQMDQQNNNQRGLGSSLFGVTIDLILGVGFSKTTFDVNKDTAGLSNPNSITGPMVGANINFMLLGFSLGTGFNYSSKGYTTTNSNSFSSNYIDIPLLFSFNFDIKKVRIDISAGPYVGILLSQDKSTLYQMKNIDIGIIGSLQGTYFFNRFLGALLGVKYEQGGLNNLLKSNSGINNYVSSIKTTNWFIYSGVKFVL